MRVGKMRWCSSALIRLAVAPVGLVRDAIEGTTSDAAVVLQTGNARGVVNELENEKPPQRVAF